MRPLLLVTALVVEVLAIGGIGYVIGKRHRPDPSVEMELREMRLREHARLLGEAREATMRGEIGLADMYAAAAERVLDPDDVP